MTEENIEKKWKHIKDAYFRSIKENKPKSGDGANKKRKKIMSSMTNWNFLKNLLNLDKPQALYLYNQKLLMNHKYLILRSNYLFNM